MYASPVTLVQAALHADVDSVNARFLAQEQSGKCAG